MRYFGRIAPVKSGHGHGSNRAGRRCGICRFGEDVNSRGVTRTVRSEAPGVSGTRGSARRVIIEEVD